MAASVTELEPIQTSPRSEAVPPLENGAHLSAREFLRRYEAMLEVKKAELINGIVYMGSPVRYDRHAVPDGLMQTFLGTYAISTMGVKHATNSTARLGPDDVPQPDGLLRIGSQYGGQSKIDAKGYLEGAPELVMEIAASSVSIDVREKLDAYRRARVREYVVWRTEDEAINWFHLAEDEYHALEIDSDGVIRSHVFPGLWLHVRALLNLDGGKVMQTLQSGLASAEHLAFVAALQKLK